MTTCDVDSCDRVAVRGDDFCARHWLVTADEAAAVVLRSKRTIMRWQEQGLIRFHDRSSVGLQRGTSRSRLLVVDAEQRRKKGGRPKSSNVGSGA